MNYAMRADVASLEKVRRRRHNVGKSERIASGLLGGAALLGQRWLHGGGKVAALAVGSGMLTRAITGHSQLYGALGVSSAALSEGAGIDIDAAITIVRPREEVYELWRNIENLPLIMLHLTSVTDVGDGVSHWRAEGPRGIHAEWKGRIITDRPGELIAWKSLPDSAVENAGSVQFRDAGFEGEKGTEVLVNLRYVPRGLAAGFALGKVLRPTLQAEVTEDLRRLKRVMETGVDTTTKGQPTGLGRR